MRTATLDAPAATRRGGPRAWACYCRLSQAKNDGKGGSLAIDRQCAENAAYVERVDPGAQVVHFHDDGKSGWSLTVVRDQFEDALRRVALGEFDAFVAWHADRISRQTEVAGRVIRLCRTHGVELHTALGGHHADPIALQIQSVVAEAESRQKANRAMSKHRQLRESGAYAGGSRRFGYEPRMVAVREDEAAVIRDMANRLLNGESLTSVVRSLNEAGVLTSTGYRENKETGEMVRVPWSLPTVKKMLTAPHLIGKRQNGPVMVDATWPAILDVATWESLRAILLDPARDKRKHKTASRYLLSGIATCGTCGQPVTGLRMDGRRVARGLTYRCRSYHVSRGILDVDAMVTEYVLGRLEEIDSSGAFASDEDSRELAALVAERDEAIPARRAEIAALMAVGTMDVDTYAAASGALADRAAAVSTAIGHLTATMTAPQRALEGVTGPSARAVWDEWTRDPSGAGFARQRAVIRLLVDVVILPSSRRGPGFDREAVRVTYRNA